MKPSLISHSSTDEKRLDIHTKMTHNLAISVARVASENTLGSSVLNVTEFLAVALR